MGTKPFAQLEVGDVIDYRGHAATVTYVWRDAAESPVRGWPAGYEYEYQPVPDVEPMKHRVLFPELDAQALDLLKRDAGGDRVKLAAALRKLVGKPVIRMGVSGG